MNTPVLKASQLDLKPLYYFLRVAEAGSFSRAAASLSVSQPLLSRTIQRLEEDLTVRLFHRTGRGTQLTEAGERLREHGEAILARLADAQHDVTALAAEAKGVVAIGMPPLLGYAITVGLIQHLRAAHPEVRLLIKEGYAAETLDWLGNGQVDVGLIYNPPQVATLLIDPLFEDTLHLVGPAESLGLLPGSAFPARMLASVPIILPPEPHRLRGLAEAAARTAGVPLRPTVEVAGTLTMLELVRAGLGFTLLPSTLAQDEVRDGRLQSWPLSDPAVHPRLCLVTSMQRPRTEAARAVVKSITALVRQRPLKP